ncbi:MAG: hypothetical protein QFX33_02210 [Candidatus Nezhaarchaeota archaeon]|nr:hypothetical protein [Candidatus Nezhaarchaeota archaeon]
MVIMEVAAKVAGMDFEDVWSLISALFSKPVELSSPAGRSNFTAWVEGDAVFVKLVSTGSIRVITRKVLEKCWRTSVEMAKKGEDPFQPAWFYRTTNGTYIARIFKYVVEGV